MLHKNKIVLMRTRSNNKAMLNLFPANSLKCYSCEQKNEEEPYPTAQCEKDQKEVECNSTGVTCMKIHGTNVDDNEFEGRSCSSKEDCERLKKTCERITEGKQKDADTKECQVSCCETDLCNSAFITSGSIAMMTGSIAVMMTAAMFSLVLF